MTPEPAPSAIVEQAQQLAEALEQWARAHRTATLAAHEQGVLALLRQWMGPLLGAVLARALELDHPRAREARVACPRCGRRRAPHEWRTRRPLTVCGATPFDRPYYYCAPCRQGWAPADAVLDLAAAQQVSAGLQAWLAREGAEDAFGPAAGRIERLTGIGVGAETVRTHTEAVGAMLLADQAVAATTVARTQEAAAPVDPAPETLLIEMDGVLVRYRDDWHEVKACLVAGCRPGTGGAVGPDGSRRAPVLLAPSYVAVRLPAALFGPRVLAEAARRGALEVVGWEQPPGTDPRLAGVTGPSLAVLRHVVILGDGAKWIWDLAAEHFGGHATEIVDWYHGTEHLWTLGRALFGEADPHTTAWVRRAEAVLWHRGAAALLPHLRRCRAAIPEMALVVRRERGYFATNVERMAYPAFRARGLPIGSGAIESTAGWLVQARCKRPGMRWSEPGAQAVLAVRAQTASGRPLPFAPLRARSAA